MKSTSEIRQAFLDYFTDRGHVLVPSSPLVPGNDPTLLFTNAGMVQFKDVFLGAEKRSYNTAVTAQRCVRAGGKHNDLDQVGYTGRHHTFFEMLGNFSFGDYFKKEAIQYAWQLLTEVYSLPAGQLWVTVYETDDEAYEIWKNDIGIANDRLIRVGDKPGGKPYESDNFWAMGDTGPCGPCTEIFYDHGPEVAGGPPSSADEDGDRYIEVWNLVFMQYDRAADGSMQPLPRPCVDTGMGLERLAAILQGRHSNYQIDLFKTLTSAAAEFTGSQDTANASLNVIADHIRACAFLITDGVLPSNEGRGYVLRRIIRRAIRHGYKLGQKQPFFSRMMDPLVAEMGTAYPELVARSEQVKTVLLDEEQRFSRTLESGMAILDGVIEKARKGDQMIDGSQAFLLYDTYGFPLDLTEDVAREHQLTVDLAGFETAMAAQRQRARDAGQFSHATQISAEDLQDIDATRFTGYEETACTANLLAVLSEDGKQTQLDVGERGILILDKTPFYAESGGQVGDSGKIRNADFELRVDDTQLIAGTLHGHYGEVLSGKAVAGGTVNADIDAVRRQAIVLHHSATHLLHAALRETLGSHVEQKGSLVAPDRLRFDFSHTGPVSPEQLQQIESRVNQQIRENPAARADLMGFDDAIEAGAMALFGEKYGEQVRVMQFGDFSVELCGGTHVGRVGDIGIFKIISETGIAAGVRRIEALAGQPAMDWVFALEDSQKRIARLMKTGADRVEEKVRSLLEQNRELEKSLDRLKSKMANEAGGSLPDQALVIEGVKLIAASLEGVDSRGLRETIDRLKAQLGSGVIVLASGEAGKVRLIAGVTSDLTDRVKAGDLVNYIAQQVGGKGGGRPDLAQAGGTDNDQIPAALESAAQWLSEKLTGQNCRKS